MKVFFDIDTQIDFLFPAGALYARGAERIIGPVAQLNRYAAEHGIPLVSTTCAHPENSREFNDWPPHCVIGSVGQQKPAATLLEKRVTIPNAVADFEITGVQQIIVQKDDLDLFSNPNLDSLLEKLAADECVVYGVYTEYCVKCAVMGLLKRGRQVSFVEEAVASVDESAGRKAHGEFVAAGARPITIADAMHRWF